MRFALHRGDGDHDSDSDDSVASEHLSDSLDLLDHGDRAGSKLGALAPGPSLSSRYHSILLRAKLHARQRSPSPWLTDPNPPLPWLEARGQDVREAPEMVRASSASTSSSSLLEVVISESASDEEEGAESAETRRPRRKHDGHDLRWAASAEPDEWVSFNQSHAFQRDSRSRFHPPQRASALASADDLDSVRRILGSLSVTQKQEEEALKQDFDKRLTELWSNIEQTIRKVEEETRKAAESEAERLRSMRLKQQEQQRIAEEARKREEEKAVAERQAKEQARKEQEQKAQAEQQAKEKAEAQARAEQQAQEQKTAAFANAKGAYDKWRESMENIKANVLPAVKANPTWKKQCFDAKRRITPKVSQLTNSRDEIIRITNSILEVLNAAKSTGTSEIYIWILNHLSKCLIRQAEQEVAVSQAAAFPLAQVTSWLLLEGHSELGTVLMSRLVKKCCWCLPYLPLPTTGQDEAAYMKSLGRKDREEAQSNYVSRMCGIFAFYVALLQTKPSPPPSAPADANLMERIPEHFRPAALWRWQAQSLQPPVVNQNLTPSLWSTLFEVAGSIVQRIYGRQAVKLWQMLYREGIGARRAKWSTSEEATAAAARLTLLLEQWQREGSFQVAKGSIMA